MRLETPNTKTTVTQNKHIPLLKQTAKQYLNNISTNMQRTLVQQEQFATKPEHKQARRRTIPLQLFTDISASTSVPTSTSTATYALA